MPKPLKRALGIDIGGSGVKGAPVHLKRGELLTDRFRIPTPQPATPTSVARAVAEVAGYFAWTGPIGCTVPARVRRGIVETAANIDDRWIGVPAAQLFREATGSLVAVMNDADAAGLAEMRYGAGLGREGVTLMLTIGTGIGSALFLDGRLVPNTEFGHLQFGDRIAEQHASDRVRETKGMRWKKWATKRLQPVLEHIEFILSPDLIIVGGGVSRPERWSQFGHLLDTQAELVPAALSNEAGIVGAALAARAQIPRKRKKKDAA